MHEWRLRLMFKWRRISRTRVGGTLFDKGTGLAGTLFTLFVGSDARATVVL